MADRDVQGRWRIVAMDLWDVDTIELIGRGWVEVVDDGLRGRIFFHFGDDSGFRAMRDTTARGRGG